MLPSIKKQNNRSVATSRGFSSALYHNKSMMDTPDILLQGHDSSYGKYKFGFG